VERWKGGKVERRNYASPLKIISPEWIKCEYWKRALNKDMVGLRFSDTRRIALIENYDSPGLGNLGGKDRRAFPQSSSLLYILAVPRDLTIILASEIQRIHYVL
jgi:hypothetical protein